MITSSNRFAYCLGDITRLFRKLFDRRATRFELTRVQWRALKSIARLEGISQAELAELLEMEPIPVGRVVDRLEQAGFVERRADPKDRRRWRLHITEKAHAVVDDMNVIGDELRNDSLRGISAEDFAVFERVLQQMKDNLVALDESDAGKKTA